VTRDDWKCPICGKVMFCSNILNPKQYMLCYMDHGKMHPAYGIRDLPQATKYAIYGWCISGHGSGYRYVPNEHNTALDRAPAEGDVVASVAFRGRRAVRLFRKKGS